MLFGKHLNKFYLRYGIFFIIGLIALIVVDYVQLFIPEFLGIIIKEVELPREEMNIELINQTIVNTILVALAMFIGRMTWRFSVFNASQRIEAGLRHDMFLKAEKLSQRYYHGTKVGTIMAWFTTDLETVEEFFGWGFIMLIDAIFLSIFAIIKLVKLDWVLSLVVALPLLLIIIWGALVEKFMALKWDARQKAFDDLYDFSQENFTGIRVIKAFVKETQELHAFAKVARKNQDANIDFVKTSVVFDVFISLIISAILALLLGVGGWFAYCYMTDNPITLFGHVVALDSGLLVTFVGTFDYLIWPMMALGQIVSMRSRAKASMKRIENFLDEEEDIQNPVNAVKLHDVKGKITFNNYTFNYPGTKDPSLKGITFEINAGETIGIVGKIGSGKSTLVNSLLRMYNIEKNSILIDDVDLMSCDIDSLREVIGYVPQDNFLFSDKVRNNIAFSNQALEYEKVELAAKFADVHDNIIEFVDGYDTISGERGVTLSGGQKQRLSIARAYIKNAPIMIMDDSVSAVDVKTEETILDNIKKYRAGKTTLVIASRVSTVQHMNRILVLNDGEVEAFDTHENLLKISPTYAKMVFLQELEKEVEGGAL